MPEKVEAPDVEVGGGYVEGLAGVLGENVVEDAGHAVVMVVYDVGDEHRAQTAVSTWRVWMVWIRSRRGVPESVLPTKCVAIALAPRTV